MKCCWWKGHSLATRQIDQQHHSKCESIDLTLEGLELEQSGARVQAMNHGHNTLPLKSLSSNNYLGAFHCLE